MISGKEQEHVLVSTAPSNDMLIRRVLQEQEDGEAGPSGLSLPPINAPGNGGEVVLHLQHAGLEP